VVLLPFSTVNDSLKNSTPPVVAMGSVQSIPTSTSTTLTRTRS
jgi:hypothetical protein